MATFSDLSINKSGTGYTMSATCAGLTTATSSAFNITSGTATSLTVSGYTSPTSAGVAHNFTVTALDQFGNAATGYRGAVTFSSSDGQAVLPASYIFLAGDNGTHTTFSATLKTAGTQSITATDSVNTLAAPRPASRSMRLQPAS